MQWQDKKDLTKNLYNEEFKKSTKCWICDNNFNDNDVKVRDHCHITGKYRGSSHKDCDINL